MNLQDNISHLAAVFSRNSRPKRLEEISKQIPYFEVGSDTFGRKCIKGMYNFEQHDNAPRMQYYMNYFNYHVFPNLDKDADITGFYNIELHDSYTYLKNGKDYSGVFSFAKFKNDMKPCLLPDPYMVGNWGGVLDVLSDNRYWSNKIDKCCFFGTTTGDRDPSNNMRIKACMYGQKHPELFNFKITNVAQMNESDIVNAVGKSQWDNIKLPFRVGYEDQLCYKYHLVLDGNTCRYDIWNYNTNTVTLKHESNEMLWYYPLLQNNEHFYEVTLDELPKAMQYFSNNPTEAAMIIKNAKSFCKSYFKPVIHTLYTQRLFEEIGHNK